LSLLGRPRDVQQQQQQQLALLFCWACMHWPESAQPLGSTYTYCQAQKEASAGTTTRLCNFSSSSSSASSISSCVYRKILQDLHWSLAWFTIYS
jgi:hypothetical protein